MESITEKSTKAEILKAYEALLGEVQAAKADNPKLQQEEVRRKEVVKKVDNTTSEAIAQDIAALKASLNESLDKLAQNLAGEHRKLADIRAAIGVEQKSLEDLYALSANTDSLAAMLLVQKTKEENFSAEMAAQRERWEQEKAKQKVLEKEYLDDLSKQRKREADEYAYTLKIGRQKEADEYAARKAQQEKELSDRKTAFEQEVAHRESELKQAEAELNDLRKTSADFPAKLDKALKDKEAEVSKTLKAQYDFDAKLQAKQHEVDVRLKEQTIEALLDKIKELQQQLKDNADKANRAEASVKDIAMKAIENASKIRMVTAKAEKEE